MAGIVKDDLHPMSEAEVSAHLNPALTAEQELEAAKIAAHSYLNSTDWYVVRFIERNIDIPDEVQVKRADAIEILNQ